MLFLFLLFFVFVLISCLWKALCAPCLKSAIERKFLLLFIIKMFFYGFIYYDFLGDVTYSTKCIWYMMRNIISFFYLVYQMWEIIAETTVFLLAIPHWNCINKHMKIQTPVGLSGFSQTMDHLTAVLSLINTPLWRVICYM